MRPDQKEEPRRGECRGSYALHRTHYLPRPNTPGHVQHALNLWQFFDGSLSISFFTTRICALELTFPRPTQRELLKFLALGGALCSARRVMHNDRNFGNRAEAPRGWLCMRWRGERESENVEDRRDEGGSAASRSRRRRQLSERRRFWPRRRHRHRRHSHHPRPDVVLRHRPDRAHAGRRSRAAMRAISPIFTCRSPIPDPTRPISRRPAPARSAARASQDHQRGRPQAVRRRGAGRHRGRLAGHLPPIWRDL